VDHERPPVAEAGKSIGDRLDGAVGDPAGFSQLGLGKPPLERDDPPAGGQERTGQPDDPGEIGYGPADHPVPAVCRRPQVLGPEVTGLDPGKAQQADDMGQEARLFPHRVNEGDRRIGDQELDHQAGKPGPGAQIENPIPASHEGDGRR